MKRLGLSAAALLVVGLILAGGCTTERVEVVKQLPPQPPAMVVESTVPSPGPQYVWVGGHYEWRRRWVWVRGVWVVPPRREAIWVGGRWVRNPRGWVWIRGHWEF